MLLADNSNKKCQGQWFYFRTCQLSLLHRQASLGLYDATNNAALCHVYYNSLLHGYPLKLLVGNFCVLYLESRFI